MKRVFVFVLLCLFSIQSQAQTRHTRRGSTPRTIAPISSPSRIGASQSSLPIRRVILYSNGVAYIERRGMVSNHAEIALSFKQSQVDDVLKSMVVLDLGKGRIGAVSYNSSAPPSARLAEIPFAIAAATEGNNGGLAGVLSQLQGARVTVVAGRTPVLHAPAGRALAAAAETSLCRPPTHWHLGLSVEPGWGNHPLSKSFQSVVRGQWSVVRLRHSLQPIRHEQLTTDN